MTRIHRQTGPTGLASTHKRFLTDIKGMTDNEAYTYYLKNKGCFKYNTEETTRIFKQMNSERCSFCTRSIYDFDTEMTVEHIQLKKCCPRKIFQWDNLLCACRTCNTKRSTKSYDRDRYLDPTVVEDIDIYFRFTLDGRIEASKKLNKVQREKAEYMIDLYCLNREDLICERRDFFRDLIEDEAYYRCLAKRGISSKSVIFWATFAYYKRSKEQNGS